MRRFFLDANVIFTAAHNPNGNGRALFDNNNKYPIVYFEFYVFKKSSRK